MLAMASMTATLACACIKLYMFAPVVARTPHPARSRAQPYLANTALSRRVGGTVAGGTLASSRTITVLHGDVVRHPELSLNMCGRRLWDFRKDRLATWLMHGPGLDADVCMTMLLSIACVPLPWCIESRSCREACMHGSLRLRPVARVGMDREADRCLCE